ncbi:MAG: pyridoxal-phosphate dependent enzyme [Armatimonadetes bacterium]|nr:pyridoxal-phosphate dependent enzyme [Armatimonadota bacterium]
MIPRIPLCCLPTPCHPLPRLSEDLGLDIWIKRDDLTGFAGGGNKGRKLEYLMADILDSSATHVVTCGSRQSNFVRQLGAACAVHNIRCSAAVMSLPFDKGLGRPQGSPPREGGNVILDELFGVDLHEFSDGDWLDLYAEADKIADNLRSKGEVVKVVPIGGSSPLGAYSFTQAAVEVGEGWDHVVTPTSSGSTHAGLAWAFHGSRTKVVGIACDPEEDLLDDLKRLTDGIDAIAGFKKGLGRLDFNLRRDWVGAGYNISSEEGAAAASMAAGREGLILDPVYSAKAFAGLLGMARSGELSGKVLFWHTGGLPTLFARP